ncbi:hypothetical protein ACMZOO_11640 [Catenovulum sp. SX2]|uniref:hypothetical protein n=1 Tax=Catenovulum sp. SX2 TaxID=3398614 RepID=UPI003F85CA20
MTDKNNGFKYARGMQTSITLEEAATDNQYSANKRYIHGYDQDDILLNCSYIETLFLMFIGERPSEKQKYLLELLHLALINLGPRHQAVRASMQAGVSKCNVEHILPIGSIISGGEQNGAICVYNTYQFLEQHNQTQIAAVVNKIVKNDIEPQIGFGQSYQDIDHVTNRHFLIISEKCSSTKMTWLKNMVLALNEKKIGILPAGLCAAICWELDFSPRQAAGIFQLVCAPAILAHGIEQMSLPITSSPMLNDENYIYGE